MRASAVRMMCIGLAMIACANGSTGPEEEPAGGDVLTPAGGTLSLRDGAITIVAPAGAVSSNVSVRVEASTDGAGDPSVVRGTAFTLSTRPATSFAQPVRVSFRYAPADGPAGVPEMHYVLAARASTGFSPVAGATVDTLANSVSANVSALGTFAVRRVPPPGGCTAPEHRQFDFWLGEWRVNTIDSDITGEAGGCALFELYKAPTPGRSISVYDERTAKWYQTYDPGVAAPFVMSGGLEADGRMVMFVVDAAGRRTQRWTWQRNADGSVTQTSEGSSDNGTTWQPAFSGTYRRR